MSRQKKTDEEKVIRKSISLEPEVLAKAIEKAKENNRGNLSDYINALIKDNTSDIKISEQQKKEVITQAKQTKNIKTAATNKRDIKKLNAINSIMGDDED